MILSDVDLMIAIDSGQLGVSPLVEGSIQPASIELHLGNSFKQMKLSRFPIDLLNPHIEYDEYEIKDNTRIKIEPGGFFLAHTKETVRIPNGTVARVEGKSSLGRFGLAIHVTAGYVDPGFEGEITLEIVNLSLNALLLTPGMKIAQLCVMQMTSEASEPYGHPKFKSHYQGQTGATASRIT